jgi:hypothetical protein
MERNFGCAYNSKQLHTGCWLCSEAEGFWVQFEEMLVRLERGWGDAAREREREEERLHIILPRRQAPPPPPRYIPSLASVYRSRHKEQQSRR